jgi:ribosome-binding factor A
MNSLIRAEIAELFLYKSKDPRLRPVTVTRALVSPDLRKARVFWSVLGGQGQVEAAEKALSKAKGFLRASLASRLELRNVPEITFELDRNPEYAQRMAGLFSQLREGSVQEAGSGPESIPAENILEENILAENNPAIFPEQSQALDRAQTPLPDQAPLKPFQPQPQPQPSLRPVSPRPKNEFGSAPGQEKGLETENGQEPGMDGEAFPGKDSPRP